MVILGIHKYLLSQCVSTEIKAPGVSGEEKYFRSGYRLLSDDRDQPLLCRDSGL